MPEAPGRTEQVEHLDGCAGQGVEFQSITVQDEYSPTNLQNTMRKK